ATGFHVARNKAVVGQNAFAHESGIHQHGMINHQQTYEVMRPEDVGFKSSNLVLGKHSGRHALNARLHDLGYQLEPEQIDKVFEELKRLADKKKEIYDGDLDALLVGLFQNGTARRWELASLNAVSGTGTPPTAAVSLLTRDARKLDEAATGDGRGASGLVRRSPPRARGDLAAGILGAARARHRRETSRPDARDHGSLDADHAASAGHEAGHRGPRLRGAAWRAGGELRAVRR